MSTDPTGRVSHIQDMHRGLTWKPAVRCATTASITISTALNNGDTLDGITLATGDRVLVKNQSTASQNGIYIVGATPTRAADMDQDTTTTTIPAEEIAGAVVFVISGTTNTKTIWYTTNAVGGTVGSTSIVWAQLSVSSIAASAVTVADAGGYLTATDVEAALQELAKKDIGYTAHGSTGATETFDALTGWHSATLDSATVTATFTGATSSLVAAMVLELTQDGSGGRLVTWPGSVVWPGGSAPTLSTGAGATDILSFFSRDGGTKWFGFMAGSGGGTGSGSITASGYTMSTARMLGRSTAATGAIEEITVGSGLSLSAGSLTATGVGVGTGARYPVQDGAASSANTNTRTVTLGATPTNGNLLIAVSVNESTFAISSVVTTNVSWSKLAGTTVGVAPVIEIWVGTISASAGTATVITYAGSTFCNFHLAEWASVTGTLDQSATLHTTTGATSGHPIPIITPTSSTALVVCGSSTTNNSTNFSGFSGVFLMQAASSAGQTIGSYFGFPGTAPVYGIASGGASSTASSITVSIT